MGPLRPPTLRQTFLHIAGIGYRRERRIWRAGIRAWEEFPRRGARAGLPRNLSRRIERELERSADALRRGHHRYFAANLPAREHWRGWPDFQGHVAYLDIETTGLSFGRDAITVVGLYDGRRERSFVRGVNLHALPQALAGTKVLVTFNGSLFDLPFLRRAFPRMRLDQIHLDLRFALHRIGFSGGLKAIEGDLGLERSDETTGLRGRDAIRLWQAYRSGDDGALDLLLDYNMEDVVNLEPLADLAYRGLRAECLEEFLTADRLGRRRAFELA